MSRFTSDTELLSALKANDHLAFETVYHRWFRELSYFSDSILNNKEDAEDVAVNCFIKLLQKNPDFESTDKLKSFLFTVARNECLDRIKMNKRHANSEIEIQQLAEDKENSIELAMIRAEALQCIYAAIENLPQQCREVIRLSFIEGKSLPEIAEQMHIAYQTVQNQKQRGLKILRLAVLNNDMISPLVLTACLMLLKENAAIFSLN
jgi:RNA polymerase sigma-70 factor (family 1)